MNDFAVDEKLLKEVRDLCSPLIKEEFPEKLKKTPVTIISHKFSENAAHKKEKNNLEHKYKLIEKNNIKLTKKNTDMTEELKNIKSQFEIMKKDFNVLSLTNERVQNEKIVIEKSLEENKTYTRKLESRLLQGAKNQYLIEINNKLRKELDDIKLELEAKSNDTEKIKTTFEKKNQEIKILNRALEIKADDLKIKGEFKTSILYDVGMCKQEIEDYKEIYEKILDKNENLKRELQDNAAKIQELNFSKTHLTELLVECENKNHNLEVEKESFQKHSNELIDERNVLKDYVEKMNREFKNLQERLAKENADFRQKLYQSEEKCVKLEELYSKSVVENNVLKQQHENMNEKINSLEQNIRDLHNEYTDLDIKHNNLFNDYKSLDDVKEQLKIDYNLISRKLEDSQNSFQQLESQNYELIKRNKNLVSTQDNFQKEVIKQNQTLLLNEQKLKEQLTKNIQELDYLKDERENLKKLLNDAVNKCSFLIKEKNDLENILINKTNQIENLKNCNHLLHKNIVKSNLNNSKLEESKSDESRIDEKFIKMSENKLEETSIVKLIRREKDKNKEILEEIRKIKSDINNLN